MWCSWDMNSLPYSLGLALLIRFHKWAWARACGVQTQGQGCCHKKDQHLAGPPLQMQEANGLKYAPESPWRMCWKVLGWEMDHEGMSIHRPKHQSTFVETPGPPRDLSRRGLLHTAVVKQRDDGFGLVCRPCSSLKKNLNPLVETSIFGDVHKNSLKKGILPKVPLDFLCRCNCASPATIFKGNP